MVELQPAPASSGFRITPQLIVGLLVIFVGVVFSLDQLGFSPAVNYLRFWPMAIIAIGVVKIRKAVLSLVRQMTSSRQSPNRSADKPGFDFEPLFDETPGADCVPLWLGLRSMLLRPTVA